MCYALTCNRTCLLPAGVSHGILRVEANTAPITLVGARGSLIDGTVFVPGPWTLFKVKVHNTCPCVLMVHLLLSLVGWIYPCVTGAAFWLARVIRGGTLPCVCACAGLPLVFPGDCVSNCCVYSCSSYGCGSRFARYHLTCTYIFRRDASTPRSYLWPCAFRPCNVRACNVAALLVSYAWDPREHLLPNQFMLLPAGTWLLSACL